MNHLRRILAALLLAALLCGTALADSAFDASLDITENADGSITVTVVDSEANNSILAEHQPTLTVACDFAYAKVTGPDGAENYYTGTGSEVSFTVYIGGAYLIESVSSLPRQRRHPLRRQSCGRRYASRRTGRRVPDRHVYQSERNFRAL